MLYDLQVTEPGKFRMNTDLITSNTRRLYNRVREVTERGQQARVRDQSGRLLDAAEIKRMDRG